MIEFTRIWQFTSQEHHSEALIVSETDKPGLVSVETTGRVFLTRAQWEALSHLASPYSSEGVRFVSEPEQTTLPLGATE